MFFRSIYYRLQCLPLLPPEHILSSFRELHRESMGMESTPFRLYFEYIADQWMKNEGPENISVYGTTMRTTSSLEVNNGVYNSSIVNRGNFYSFVHDLRLQEFISTLPFNRYCESGGQAKKNRTEYKVVFMMLYFMML